jgi:hypothetical protein
MVLASVAVSVFPSDLNIFGKRFQVGQMPGSLINFQYFCSWWCSAVKQQKLTGRRATLLYVTFSFEGVLGSYGCFGFVGI